MRTMLIDEAEARACIKVMLIALHNLPEYGKDQAEYNALYDRLAAFLKGDSHGE